MRNDLELTPWVISQKGSGWVDEFCESIFFIGNGRMGIRGYVSSEPAHRPIQKGVYLAGIFGEIKPGITDFVNLPTPVCEKIYIDGAEAELASEIERVLNIKEATLTMRYTLRSGEKTLAIEHQRFLPKEHPALIMQRLLFTPGADMNISVAGGIMLDSCNSPIPDDQTKANTETIQLSQLVSASASENGICCSFDILGANLAVMEEVRIQSTNFMYSHSDGTDVCYQAAAQEGTKLVLDKAA